MLKRLVLIALSGLILVACATDNQATEPAIQSNPAATETLVPTNTIQPTNTLLPSNTPTFTPTFTLVPTNTRTPKPSATPLGGGTGNLMMFINLNLVRLSMDEKLDYDIVVPIDEIIEEFEIEDFSTLRNDFVSPEGDLAAVWNCSSEHCDTVRGALYLFSTDWKQKTTIDVPGLPYFQGLSSKNDRLLYYLKSTMADDYYLIKTKGSDFGGVIPLGRLSDVTWAPDRETLYAQKGSTVYQLDKDGKELKTYQCIYNNACINAPSPDGKRFAGIQKFVPNGTGNPVITISNQDFTDKKSIFISDNDALILSLQWLPDNQHIIVFGQTARQRIRRFWRFDYLSIIDVDSGNERVIKLNIPEDSEWFSPCGLTPDGMHLIYLGAGGRVKEEGRILMSGRFAQMFPINAGEPEFERITFFEESWESCPVWLP